MKRERSLERSLKKNGTPLKLANKGQRSFLDEVGDIPLELQAKLLRVCKRQGI